MKKLAIFLTDLGGGGAEKVMVNLANEFASRQVEVDLLLVKREGVYLSQVSSAVNLIDLGTKKLLLSLPKLVSYLRGDHPDALLTALEDTNVVAIAARLIARGLDTLSRTSNSAHSHPATRLIVTVHNNLSQEALSSEGLKRKLVPKILKWVYPFADSVVAVSKGVAADLVDLGIRPQQVRVIYNPILTPEFDALAAAPLSLGQSFESASLEKVSLKRASEWLSNKTVPVLLGIGRLVPQKDFQTLIRAFALAKVERPLRLLILGEGRERAALEALTQQLQIADVVAFTGFVENPLAYLKRVDLCVLSSAWEGFGNVLVEAMGVGTPVVSTNCPSGPTEILAGGSYGKLVPVGDAVGLARAILSTLDWPLPDEILKHRAADFSVSAVADQYEQLLRSFYA